MLACTLKKLVEEIIVAKKKNWTGITGDGQIDEMSYPSMFTDVVKQLTSRHILHDHEEICGCAYHLVPKTHI